MYAHMRCISRFNEWFATDEGNGACGTTIASIRCLPGEHSIIDIGNIFDRERLHMYQCMPSGAMNDSHPLFDDPPSDDTVYRIEDVESFNQEVYRPEIQGCR